MTSDTTAVIFGVFIIILTSTLIPIGIEGSEVYAPYIPLNETEPNEESDTSIPNKDKDSETEIEIDANAISPLGEKDVICENTQPERNHSQQERQDKCATAGTSTGYLKYGQHKSNTDAYKDPDCASWGELFHF
jgi:hypothetical protein